MAADLFEFWSAVAPDAHIHPADEEVFSKVNHGFDLSCLPGAYVGPLKTAKVVLLFLSPGLDSSGFDTGHAASIEGQKWYCLQRSGVAPLPSLAEHPPHYRWWASKIRQFGVAPEAARDRVAVLDMCAYHSRSFSDWHMLTALPSSRAALGWAQSVLFPEAVSGTRIVICLRSPSYWGLGSGKTYGAALFTPKCNRGAFMLKGDNRDHVINAVQSALS